MLAATSAKREIAMPTFTCPVDCSAIPRAALAKSIKRSQTGKIKAAPAVVEHPGA